MFQKSFDRPFPSGHGAYLSFSTYLFRLYRLSAAYFHHLRGIGLETCILFAREGANVLMADISGPGLEKALAKLKQLIPSHNKVEVKARTSCSSPLEYKTYRW